MLIRMGSEMGWMGSWFLWGAGMAGWESEVEIWSREGGGLVVRRLWTFDTVLAVRVYDTAVERRIREFNHDEKRSGSFRRSIGSFVKEKNSKG